jgi:ElaB/YqjD/DUF883 family membrane-anchored ribosome-binding protein
MIKEGMAGAKDWAKKNVNSGTVRNVGIGAGALIAGAGVYRAGGSGKRKVKSDEKFRNRVYRDFRNDTASIRKQHEKKLALTALSAREELDSIMFMSGAAIAGGAVAGAALGGLALWSQRRRDNRIIKRVSDNINQSQQGKQFSAQEELDLITFSKASEMKAKAMEALEALKTKAGGLKKGAAEKFERAKAGAKEWGKESEEYIRHNPSKAVGIAAGTGFLTGVVARKPAKEKKLSSREELNLILFGGDPRPRNSLGMFSGGGEGGPNPQSMQITYQPQVVQQGAQQASMAGVPEVQQGQQPMPPQPPQQDPQQKPKKIVKR